jgi:hypothetical protein
VPEIFVFKSLFQYAVILFFNDVSHICAGSQATILSSYLPLTKHIALNHLCYEGLKQLCGYPTLLLVESNFYQQWHPVLCIRILKLKATFMILDPRILVNIRLCKNQRITSDISTVAKKFQLIFTHILSYLYYIYKLFL